MGFADRLRAWLRGDDPGPSSTVSGGASGRVPAFGAGAGGGTSRGRKGRRARTQRPESTFDASELLLFATSRRGVEVYLEPRTRIYGDSVLLVADDGEYLRRPVPDPETVRRLCSEHGIPVYDAARTGYPRRVRDYDLGVRREAVELTDLPPWPGSGPEATTPAEEPPADEQPTGGHPTDEEEPPPPPPSAGP